MLPSIFGERLFDDMFNDPFMLMPSFYRHDPIFGKNAKNLMKTDVRELEHAYELDVDLPGFKKEDVNIELDNGYLTIKAAKNLDKDDADKKGQYLRRERYSGECSRSFYIGSEVEPGDVHAKFEDGILQISFPKAPEPKQPESKQIAIA
ncbi:Hsp20/alpha crystallin family protein [uncultured Mailhella sp.]|uniref:Hsp20/alpha crystallin family protein n=1 Tax=uncultured Mailhella sp. TaxID=1981031 RepID=UPI00261B0321|nr:Hsp20/alpha crystallin family protein [uncultured Mailhella sp.]